MSLATNNITSASSRRPLYPRNPPYRPTANGNSQPQRPTSPDRAPSPPLLDIDELLTLDPADKENNHPPFS